MGGDTFKDDVVDEESSRSSSSSPCSCCFSDDLGFKDDVSEENFTNFSNHVTDLRRREKAYQEILQSHDLLLRTSKRKLRQARNEILSYTPGSWSDVKLSDYNIPKTTSIMLVGPKGAGKSSLVNKITRVIEDDAFLLDRVQESFGTPSKGGTYFVQEYMISRGGSASFCLYDTRGLSRISSSDNTSMIEQWMTRGVLHGEPVIWASDSSDLKDRLIRDGGTGYERRKVNSIIFVVNAVEILKSMECETSYASMITTAFNSPILLFKGWLVHLNKL
jgi:energy-coupling factor transporter ATP-binding protein EcfA2